MTGQDRTPLFDAVTGFIETEPAYFRIPGHRLERGISPRWTDRVGKGIFAYDVTETPFTDDLHNPQGAIREAQELLSGLYGADKSFFLVNGTTCGNEAMIMGAAFGGQEIMVARNAHKSAMMGLILSGAKPVYVMPEIIDEWGIQGAVTPKAAADAFAEHPGCRALFLVSPSYYGICSDLEGIAQVCHAHGALLLVDEAHGGHVYFHSRLPQGAIGAGADICVQSMHKVAGALTQSSVLHMKDHGIGGEILGRVAKNLHLVQSTSPSYLLMTSLDCARHELAMNGTEMMEEALLLADYARREINGITGFGCMDGLAVQGKAADMDRTRLVITAKELGLSGFGLDRLLFEKYAVNMELSDYGNVLAVFTYANTWEDAERLVRACSGISRELAQGSPCRNNNCAIKFPPLPQQVMTPRRAYFSKTGRVSWQKAAGKIAGQMIAPYPPGIPAVYPGERISREVWEYIEQFRRDGRPMHGTDGDGRLDEIDVIDEI